MRIEAQDVPEAPGLNCLEAHTINQAEASAILSQEASDPLAMESLGDPIHRKEGENVLIEVLHRLEPEPALEEGDGLDQDIGGRPDRPSGFKKDLECGSATPAVFLASHQQGIET